VEDDEDELLMLSSILFIGSLAVGGNEDGLLGISFSLALFVSLLADGDTLCCFLAKFLHELLH